jgi:cell division septal protein FtsQ
MKSKPFRILLIVTTILTLTIILMVSPVFQVKNIIITGNYRVTEQEIIRLAGLQYEGNIFAFSKRRASKNIMQNLFVEDVEITTSILRREIKILIDERVLRGYIEHAHGMYLHIDENGRVLDNKTYYTQDLPIIVGLQFESFQVGEVLEVNNPKSFETIVLLNELLAIHDMGSHIVRINVEEPNEITMYVDNVFIRFGSMDDAEEKILILKAVMENMPNKEMRWILDMRDLSRQLVLQVMT